jgi:signal transduction histidine kinase
MPEASARHIVINLHNDSPIAIYADKGEIEIILNNLITNAVKYNRDSGEVDITISKENGFQ